jgi:hypothetical protein
LIDVILGIPPIDMRDLRVEDPEDDGGESPSDAGQQSEVHGSVAEMEDEQVGEDDWDYAVGGKGDYHKDGHKVGVDEAVGKGGDLDGTAEEALGFMEFDKAGDKRVALLADGFRLEEKGVFRVKEESKEGEHEPKEKYDAALHHI